MRVPTTCLIYGPNEPPTDSIPFFHTSYFLVHFFPTRVHHVRCQRCHQPSPPPPPLPSPTFSFQDRRSLQWAQFRVILGQPRLQARGEGAGVAGRDAAQVFVGEGLVLRRSSQRDRAQSAVHRLDGEEGYFSTDDEFLTKDFHHAKYIGGVCSAVLALFCCE